MREMRENARIKQPDLQDAYDRAIAIIEFVFPGRRGIRRQGPGGGFVMRTCAYGRRKHPLTEG